MPTNRETKNLPSACKKEEAIDCVVEENHDDCVGASVLLTARTAASAIIPVLASAAARRDPTRIFFIKGAIASVL